MIAAAWKEARGLPRDSATLRKFGVVVGLAFLAIAFVVFWRSGWGLSGWSVLPASLGLLLVLTGLAAPRALKTVYPLWMGIALVLGTLMTHVLLTLVFFLVVTPTAFALRLVGKDPMNRRPDPDMATYWSERSAAPVEPERLEKLY